MSFKSAFIPSNTYKDTSNPGLQPTGREPRCLPRNLRNWCTLYGTVRYYPCSLPPDWSILFLLLCFLSSLDSFLSHLVCLHPLGAYSQLPWCVSLSSTLPCLYTFSRESTFKITLSLTQSNSYIVLDSIVKYKTFTF